MGFEVSARKSCRFTLILFNILNTLNIKGTDTLEPLGFNLGARLKAVREVRGISQRELARRAGVTNGTISLIEKNKNSPSVSSLKRLLDGIPMGLGEFFALEETPADKVFFTKEEMQTLIEGDITYRLIGDNKSGHSLQILHEKYAPGADTGKSMLKHQAEEGGIVIKGEIEITVGEQVQTLGPGQAYYFDSTQPHRFKNRGDIDCEIISACSPPYL